MDMNLSISALSIPRGYHPACCSLLVAKNFLVPFQVM